MTSRNPRDSRLRIVRPRPLAPVPAAAPPRARRRPAPRPPEGTPAPSELAAMAREGLASAARIARWAGHTGAVGQPNVLRTAPGGALTAAAAEQAAAALELTPQQVRTDWDTARLAGLIEVHGDTARAGWRLRAWDRDDSAVLRGWVALFDAWSLVHPAPAELAPAAVSEVIEAVPQLLSVLQLSQGPVPLPQLLDLLGQRVTELRDERCEIPYGPQPEPVPADTDLAPLLDWALAGLAAVGALTLDEGDEGQATMTPLGSWAVWVKLEQIIVAAQSPAGNIEQAAEDMLRGCARLRPNAARAEYRAWLAARPVGSAVGELLDAARGEDSLLRGLAFEALRVVGAPAEPDVRAASDELLLRPYALIWLAEQEGCDPEDVHSVLTREESTWLWVDTAAAVADHGEATLLVRHLEAAVQPTIPQLLAEVRAVGHPRTVQVLVALAAAHPDPALAKAVRRAAFQVHTGGA
ncbi:hypothetical protein H9Y04_04610 [Streptomyces sp. TRM66268-LWL]|uniref:Uncharacterized protein n=1 Tax=Streptomyces polyasparticus TaxID=2767826 RepID=A0ABR7SBH8_9ACTN|nr:hypothetical protein [Streptomyces polyasparticus]MBC9711851.1 hypothetical protein [Streptomyces polyasparticus]